MQILVIVAIIAAVGIILFLSWYLEKKRREAFEALGNELNLRYDHTKDYSWDNRYSFLDKTHKGYKRYARHRFKGDMQGHRVQACEFHYATKSRSSKGKSQTRHHYMSFFLVDLPTRCPELTIAPEGFFSKIAQFAGYEDIDFESAEFSRKFVVRSADRKFAYNVITPQMMEWLLKHRKDFWEIEQNVLCLVIDRGLKPEMVKEGLDRLLTFRKHIPDHVLASRS